LWAINGAASVAGGIVAVLALRVGGSTHALIVAAATYAVAAAIAYMPSARSS
jgi:polysaccharide pyruvyl transferase WcaK-like protein